MTAEQLMIELWDCQSDAQVVLVIKDGTEECYIQEFSLKREDDKVLLIEKSFDSRKHEIFEFMSYYYEGPVVTFRNCNLNQQVGMHEEGTYFPTITINVKTNGMSLFDDNDKLLNYYQLKQTWELA